MLQNFICKFTIKAFRKLAWKPLWLITSVPRFIHLWIFTWCFPAGSLPLSLAHMERGVGKNKCGWGKLTCRLLETAMMYSTPYRRTRIIHIQSSINFFEPWHISLRPTHLLKIGTVQRQICRGILNFNHVVVAIDDGDVEDLAGELSDKAVLDGTLNVDFELRPGRHHFVIQGCRRKEFVALNGDEFRG